MLLLNGKTIRVDDYFVKQLASGYDELIFDISIWDPIYTEIQEESNILESSPTTGGNSYLVKAIDSGSETATVKCVVDVDEWKAEFTPTYTINQLNPGEVVTGILPTGWTMENDSGISDRRSAKLEGVTPYAILEAMRDMYDGLTFRFDCVNKVITLVNMANGDDLGAFITRDLNLKADQYKGKSTSFATRLYAYGKDDLSFASINDGKAYVDNHTYSDRVISAYWKDERYTDAALLLQAATSKLAEMAVPSRSFECDVADLQAMQPLRHPELKFTLFSKAALFDPTRSNAKIVHKVVERRIYPYYLDRNRVTLSTVPQRIQSQVVQIANSFSNANSAYNMARSAAQMTAIEKATADILGAEGGSVRLLDTNSDGELDTLYIADNPDPSQAVKVWRFNYEGWGASSNGFQGPFTLGATLAIGIVADFITAGVLSADRIAANSIAVSKLSGTIANGAWEIDLTNGTLTIGTISADNITAGTINAANINVTNINGQNINSQSIGSDQLGSGSVINRILASSAVENGNVLANTLTTAAMSAGINAALAGGDLADSVFNQGTQAPYGSFNRLYVNGEQFTKQLFQFVDGNGQTVQGYFLMLLPPTP